MGRSIHHSIRAVVLASGSAVGMPSILFAGVAAWSVPVVAASASLVEEGTEFVVGAVEVVYAPGTGGPVDVGMLRQIDVALVRQADGLLVGPGGAGTPATISLATLGDGRTERFDSSGLRAVMEAVHATFKARTGMRAYVVPDSTQVLLRGAGEDYRGGGTGLRIVVYPSRVLAGESPRQRESAPSSSVEPQASDAASGEPSRGVGPDAEMRAGSAARGDSSAEASVIMETTDPDDGRREPPARMARGGEPIRIASPDGRVYDPDELPLRETAIDPEIDGGFAFSMTGFEFSYPKPHPDLPPPDALNEITVRLIRTASGFIAREGEGELVRLGDLGRGSPDRLYHSAFEASLAAVLRSFREQSIVGVLVTPDPDKGIGPDEIEGYYDERSDYGVTSLPLLVYVPQVTRLKTIASGDRIPTEDRLNSDKHRTIVRGSPLQPGAEGMPNALLRFEPLNTYAFLKSRHPGRRVDVAIADASVPGEPETQGDAEVQYLVQEIKPWTAYFQLSNTGTEQTDEWRERFGFVHNQLIGFDDILSMDYITSNFRESHAFIGSYNLPLTPDGRLRGGVNLEWTEYRASDVGVANERFEGRTFGFGGELSYNFVQVDDFFLDAYGSLFFRDIEVTNVGLVDGRGQEDVLVADFGVRAERQRANYALNAELGVEVSLNDLLSTSSTQLERLGRLNPDENWTALHWDLDFSFYLDGVGSWNAGNRVLVHELATRFSGQYAFNNRLIPNYQTVGGGLYRVRGYDESVVAGDSGVFGTVEYRFHLPNALPESDNAPTVFGRPFRVVRDSEGLPPDWDCILKAFVDAGYVSSSRALGFENEESLLSVGLGLEVRLASNFSFRTDWGVVLDEIRSDTPDPTTEGTQRWHFVFTLLY